MDWRTRIWKLHCRLPGYHARYQGLAVSRFFLPGWPEWPRVLEYTMVQPSRLKALERFATTCTAPGVFMECGVARGGTALLLGLIAAKRQRDLWLFDTFEGLPPPTENDPDYDRAVLDTGTCRGELSEVQALLTEYGVWDRTRAVKGLFQNTLPETSIPSIAFLHLDGDWYDSTMTCLTHLWPHVSSGGIVQFDDYGAWQGCRKAVDEFFGGINLPTQRIDHHGVWVQKP